MCGTIFFFFKHFSPFFIFFLFLSQIIPLHQVLQVANSGTGQRQLSQLKSLAFSVFSQCHQTVNPSLPGRSLTGFGPAAELDKVIKAKEVSHITHVLGKTFPYLT